MGANTVQVCGTRPEKCQIVCYTVLIEPEERRNERQSNHQHDHAHCDAQSHQ